jgi:hypothetical protein
MLDFHSTRREKRMKRFVAILGAILSGAISIAVLAPHAAEAGFSFN